jgi:hypothetical protein
MSICGNVGAWFCDVKIPGSYPDQLIKEALHYNAGLLLFLL